MKRKTLKIVENTLFVYKNANALNFGETDTMTPTDTSSVMTTTTYTTAFSNIKSLK